MRKIICDKCKDPVYQNNIIDLKGDTKIDLCNKCYTGLLIWLGLYKKVESIGDY